MAMVYLIDGDASVRKALVRLMKSEKLPVQAYASGQDFDAAARPTEYDCVVVDINAPGMTGLELLRHMREDGIGTPLILLTQDDNEETRSNARQLDATACFLKPVDGQALVDTIRYALNKTGS